MVERFNFMDFVKQIIGSQANRFFPQGKCFLIGSFENSDARLQRAFQLVFSRPPGPAEKQAAEDFLGSARGRYGSEAGAEAKVWADFCQMLLASNGFLYVD